MDIKKRVSPGGMFWLGKEFIDCARLIRPIPQTWLEELQQDSSPLQVPYYLLAHGIELQLKAFLISKGFTVKDLRSPKKYGHDLEKLLGAAEHQNIKEHVLLNDSEKCMITLLNIEYNGFVYSEEGEYKHSASGKRLEYFWAGFSSLPNYAALSELANTISVGLDGYIQTILRQKYS